MPSATRPRSAPAQKSEPAPASTATLAASSASKARKASRSRVAVASSSALRLCGRFSTIVVTAPLRSTRTGGSSLADIGSPRCCRRAPMLPDEGHTLEPVARGRRSRARNRTGKTMNRRRWLATALCAACATATPVLAQAPSTHRHRFSDAERWAQVFDDPKRDLWQKPDEVLRALALPPDAVVADLGAGTGYFAVRLARRLPSGRVYGVDVEPDMVRHLAERA